jgi:hypothetical protein
VQLLESLIELWAEHVNGEVPRDGYDFGHARGHVDGEVGLRQQDDRRGAALARQQNVALEPTSTEVGVEGHHEENDVHIRRDHLLVGHVARSAAREFTTARQDGLDRAAVFRRPLANRHPVTHGRKLGTALGTMFETSGGYRIDFTVFDIHAVVVVELDGNSPGLHVLLGAPRRKMHRQVVAPSQLIEPHHELG